MLKIAYTLHVQNDSPLYIFIKRITECIGINLNNVSIKNMNSVKKLILGKRKGTIEELYLNKIKESSRLKLYSQVKKKLIMESYLRIENQLFRKSVTQIKLSSHKLLIVVL